MSYPDIDEVLNYLSTKFNKIFCDRDFVGCVTQDFQTILENKHKCCVLVFPALGPIYVKAVRYQARIFDLAAFSVGTGKLRLVAVCHKDHLLHKPTTSTSSMAEIEMKEETAMSDVSCRRKRPERQLYVPPAQRKSRLSRPKSINDSAKVTQPDTNNAPTEDLINLNDLVDIFYNFNLFQCGFVLKRDQIPHHSCEFRKFIDSDSFQWFKCIPIYTIQEEFYIHWLINVNCNRSDFIRGKCSSSPLFQREMYEKEFKPQTPIVTTEEKDNYFNGFKENGIFTCDFQAIVYEWEVLDLSKFNLGHFCMIENLFFECQENHDVQICCGSKFEAVKAKIARENASKEAVLKSEAPIKNVCEHEQEKEIMRKTKENINRKTRPIMKYVVDHNDTLKIGKNDGVNNWEDLFDDEGQIQEVLLTDIVDKVGGDVTVVKVSEDYSAYANKPIEELEHVVELFNFPATMETHDLVQAFSYLNSDSMYIKWVDDTHALLVLGSLSQAQKAVSMDSPLIKVRPMTAASAMSMDVANKSDLRPAMKRPATNLQTARRLITSHLGQKSRLSKEQMAKEKQDLKNAKEMKRLIKQNEKDAWEGNLRSSVK